MADRPDKMADRPDIDVLEKYREKFDVSSEVLSSGS